MDPNDWVSWEFVLEKGSAFRLEVTYACDKGTGSSELVVEVGVQKLTGAVEQTGSWTNFITRALGTVTLQHGRYALSVRATKKAWLCRDEFAAGEFGASSEVGAKC